MSKKIYFEIYDSPAGRLAIGACGGELCACDWAPGGEPRQLVRCRLARLLGAERTCCGNETTAEAIRQLQEYFSGRRTEFDLPLAMPGTPFQQAVWQALLQVPYGATASYSALAAMAGHPGSARATASACRANAISIIVPCHRIVAANGALTGYAGGLDAKRALLAIETSAKK